MIQEALLNAVLHLFAMQASRLRGAARDNALQRVRAYLNTHVGLSNAELYIGLFAELTEIHEAETDPAILEHAGQMAARLKSMLHGFERHAAALRFMELAALAPADGIPRQIARLLGHELGLDPPSIAAILAFITDPGGYAQRATDCRVLGGEEGSFCGRLAVLRLPTERLYLAAPISDETIRMEGHALARGGCVLLRSGQVLRDARGNEMYFPRIVAAFEEKADAGPGVVLRGEHLEFRFPGSDAGLHDFTFSEHGGRMVAIMGGSGAGKSTLMGILNGTIRPDSGALLLNERNVYKEPEAIEGVIGFVPQDDLLFEDLTVFQNLYYAARLCMAHLPENELASRVNELLADLGQAEAAHLKVGSPLQKTISGGQRKRLNIALELIREPTVLFVDEPTSGLSSSDSELVMSLLKEQAARGKLVFVVIHQPSSKIFRMFDALWMLDQGGWPIFCGTPLEAVTFFRSRGGLPGAEEAICSGCGNVNPEQLFEIIGDPLLDPAGRPTRERRIPPEKWRQLFLDYAARRAGVAAPPVGSGAPEKNLHRPGRWGQLAVFFARDVRARMANRPYLAITLLEPLVLGLLLGLVSRGAFGGSYAFHDNNNLHVFFFMSVIVALFLGLSVSAEEICRDGRILSRERFLHLSWWSYINSKSIYLALTAAIQMLLYLAVAVPLVALPGMFLKMWAMLFACAFSSSMLGLNISASFRSAVTIYILVPLLLIPQMLLCGVVIKYDDLIAPHSSRREVPGYANLLPPRWAYEALVVEQYSHNAYTRHFLAADARTRLAEHDLDYYLPELQSRVQSVALLRDQGQVSAVQEQLCILQNELARLENRTGLTAGLRAADFGADAFTAAAAGRATDFLAQCRRLIFEQRRTAAAEKREIEAALTRSLGRDGLETFRKKHTNTSIQDQVLNLRDMEPVGAATDGLYHKTLPIYRVPESRWGAAHFLAGYKRLGQRLIPTWSFNLAAIYALTFVLYLALGFKVLPRLLLSFQGRRKAKRMRKAPGAA